MPAARFTTTSTTGSESSAGNGLATTIRSEIPTMRVKVRFDMPDTLEDGRRPSLSLTAGEEHFVLGVSDEHYRVIVDDGEPVLYEKLLFEVIDASIPPGWAFREYDE